MSSAVAICNLALSHLGQTKRIASLSEQSQEARLCNIFYETTRDAVLKDRPWPFATKIAALGLVEEDPNLEWKYSYRYPSDCLHLRKVLSGDRNDYSSARAPYRVGLDSAGRLIFTDYEEASIEYSSRVTDPEVFPADFVLCLSFRLAAYLAPALTAGDPFKLGERSMQMYQIELGKASANAFNEEQPDPTRESELIKERE